MKNIRIQALVILLLIIALAMLSFQYQKLTERISLMQAQINCLEHNLLQLSKDQLRITEAFAIWLESWQIDTFEASAYSPLDDRNGLSSWGDGEYMASGAKTAEHIDTAIAVDKNVIPLGTRVFIQGLGWRVAQDTGGLIKGKRIDVCMRTFEEAMEHGRKDVLVIYPKGEI